MKWEKEYVDMKMKMKVEHPRIPTLIGSLFPKNSIPFAQVLFVNF